MPPARPAPPAATTRASPPLRAAQVGAGPDVGRVGDRSTAPPAILPSLCAGEVQPASNLDAGDITLALSRAYITGSASDPAGNLPIAIAVRDLSMAYVAIPPAKRVINLPMG